MQRVKPDARGHLDVERPRGSGDERLARAILDAIPDLVFRIDREGTFVDFLPAKGKEPFLPKEAFLGRKLSELFPEMAEEAMEKIQRAMDGGSEQTMHYELPIDEEMRSYEARYVAYGDSEVVAIIRDVTDRVATEGQLRQSEERFRSLVETAGDAILLLSPDGAILEFNREAERVYGFDRDEVLGRNYFELFIPETHRESLRADARKVLGGEPTRGFVNPVTARDGTIRLISWNVDRVMDASGNAVGTMACGRDVTQEKKLEEGLLSIAKGISAVAGETFFREMTEKLAEVLEADIVMLGELVKGEPERIRTFARTVDGAPAENITYELRGSPCENVVGKRMCSYASGVSTLFPRDRALVDFGIEAYVGVPLFDSQERPLGLINVLYRDPLENIGLSESVLRIFATRVATELERKRAEEELQASEKLNRHIIQAMPGGILRFAPDGAIVQANDQAQAFLGLSFDEATRRYQMAPGTVTLWENGALCPPSEYPSRKCLATGEPQPPRVIGIRRQNEETSWGLFTAFPLEGPDGGGGSGAAVMFVDITERKKSEEERRRLEAQIQHAQKLESLGVMAGGIAHDFNNLLTGILGNVSLAAMKLPPSSDLRENLARVERAAERAAELTNQMLAYAGKGNFVVGPVSLNPLIRDLVPLLESSLSKKAKLEYVLDPELPEVEADRSQLQQVVMNLVTNASDALGDHEGWIRIHTGTLRGVRTIGGPDDRWIFLEVADTGSGMDPETRERIFDPFFTTKFTGRGLGLAAVEGIVRGHRGSIRVDSRPGEGTTVTILLPESDSASEEERVSSPTLEPPVETGTVLVIDDEPAVREVARSALESAGYRVRLARDGLEGLRFFEEQSADTVAVVVDVSMPHMNGAETVGRILAIRPDIRVLLMSGYSEQDAVGRFEGSAPAFIQKPFRAAELTEAVKQLLLG